MRERIVLAAALPIAMLACGGCGQGAGSGAGGTAASATPTLSAAPAASPTDKTPGDWPTFNRTLAGDRFSPLAEIDRANVAAPSVCSYALPEVTALQTGPIVVAGTMYFTTDTISYAIDAATCAEKWIVVRPLDSPRPRRCIAAFAYMNGRLFRGTSDAHVVAMDAADGHTLWDVVLDVPDAGMTVPMAPIAGNGLVFIGNAGGDLSGIIGHVYALDARDGHMVWRFDVVPRPDRRARHGRTPTAIPFPAARSGRRSRSTSERRAVCACGKSGARLRRRIARRRQPLYEFAHRAGRRRRASFSATTSSSNTTLTTGTSTARRRWRRRAAAARSPRPRTRTDCSRSSTFAVTSGKTLRPERRSRRRAAARLSVADDDAREHRHAAVARPQDALLSRHSGRQRMERRGVLPRSTRCTSAPPTGAHGATRSRVGAGAARRSGLVRRASDPWTHRRSERLAHGVRRRQWRGALEVRGAAPMLAGVTPTAGGLVFAADLGGHLDAFDADKGEGALGARRRPVDRRRHRELFGWRSAARRGRIGHEVADLARRDGPEPDPDIRSSALIFRARRGRSLAKAAPASRRCA